MAEISGQVGFPSGARPARRPRYATELELLPAAGGETVELEGLLDDY